MPTMSIKQVYPWQQRVWEQLQQRRQMNQLAHAYLLEAKMGMGQQDFIELLAASLFCQTPNMEGYACGCCQGCHLFQADSHPDWHVVSPITPSKTIKIEQIRELVDVSQQTAQLHGYTIILITPAQTMNTASANALLKTLEEPGVNTLLFLLAENAAQLPITVRSRCQLLRFCLPTQMEALAWLESKIQAPECDYHLLLKLAQGMPLQALTLYQNQEYLIRKDWFHHWSQWLKKQIGLMECMQRLQQVDLSRLLFHMTTWVADLIRLQANATVQELTNADLYTQLHSLSQQLDAKQLMSYWSYLQNAVANLHNHPNLNATLVLEDILLSLIAQLTPTTSA